MSMELTVIEQEKKNNWGNFGVSLYRQEQVLILKAGEIISKIKLPEKLEDVEAAEKLLKDLKLEEKALQESRKKITSKLDDLTSRLMQPEKRLPSELQKLSNAIIVVKKRHEEDKAKDNAKIKESANIKAKVITYVADMNAALLEGQSKLLFDSYNYALDNVAVQDKDEYLAKVKKRVTEANQTIPRPQFVSNILTQAEIEKIIDDTFSVRPASEYVKNYEDELALKFSDFKNAKEDKEQAKINAQNDRNLEVTGIEDKKKEEVVSAQIIALSDTSSSVITPSDVKELKKVYSLSLEESEANADIILSAYVANMKKVKEQLRIEKWFNLSIKNIIKALEKLKNDDENFNFTGAIWKEETKL